MAEFENNSFSKKEETETAYETLLGKISMPNYKQLEKADAITLI
jgi:hypothetical protein